VPPRRIARHLAALAFLVACATHSTTAYAHNGIGAAFKGQAGNYIVYAYDGDPLNKDTLEYRLVVLNAHTKTPIYDVHVAVTATWPGYASAVATVTTFGNVFFYDLPNPYPRDWQMHLTLNGRLGKAAATYKMHGAAPRSATLPVVTTTSGSTPWGPITGGIGGVLAIGAAVAAWSGRRRRAPAQGPIAPARHETGSSRPDSHTPEQIRGSSAR
jgi:hypothetical protein